MNKTFLIFFIFVISMPIFCFAQSDINPISSTTFGELIDNIAGAFFHVAIVLGPLMIIVGAFLMLFAGVNPSKIALGKKTILYTSIIFGIITIVKALTYYFRNDLSF